MPDLPTIIQDTREPDEEHDPPEALFAPYIVRRGERVGLPLRRVKLDEGDYTAEGLGGPFVVNGVVEQRKGIVIERKTASDLLGTLFGRTTNALGEAESNLERFHVELQRLTSYHRASIVVECSLADIDAMRAVKGRNGRELRQFNPGAVRSLIHSFWVNYGIPTIWAGSRDEAEHAVGAMLHYAWLQSRGGEAAAKARARGSNAPWLPRSV